MTTQVPTTKKSFAQMAAAGTSITVSSIPVSTPVLPSQVPTSLKMESSKAPSNPSSKSNLDLDAKLPMPMSLSNAIHKVSKQNSHNHYGSSSNGTASTDGNSTSSGSASVSTDAPTSTSTSSPSSPSSVPASVPKPVTVSAAPAASPPLRNPWKMDLVKQPVTESGSADVSAIRSDDAPTPAESKDMRPAIPVAVAVDSSAGTEKNNEGKLEGQAQKSESRSPPPLKTSFSPKSSPSRKAADGSTPANAATTVIANKGKKVDRSDKQATIVNNSTNHAAKKLNKEDSSSNNNKTQRNKSQSKKGHNSSSGHKTTNSKKGNGTAGSQNKNHSSNNKATKNKKQTNKRKNKSQKKNKGGANSNANYTPTPQDLAAFKKSAVQQVEYFFSTDELVRNIYLRKQMDLEGFLPAAIVFNFPTVLMYGVPYDELLEAVKACDSVEVDSENECLRVKGGEEEYKKWLFPNEDGTLGCAKWIKEPAVVVEDSDATIADAAVESETQAQVDETVAVNKNKGMEEEKKEDDIMASASDEDNQEVQ